MAILVTQELEGVSQEMYDSVNSKLRPDSDPPAGLIIHTAGPVEGGWRIVDVWESADEFQRFNDERVRPAVMAASQEAGFEAPAPKVTVSELYNVGRP